MKRSLIVVMLCLAFRLMPLSHAVARDSEGPDHHLASALRVMPVGDSITVGIGSSSGGGYRADLWNELVRAGFEVDFVGTQRSGQLADPDHEGYSGRMIADLEGYVACSVPRYRPNVVNLHLGTNDMGRGDLVGADLRLGRLIDRILTLAPEVIVLVASLVPATDLGMQRRIEHFNAQIRQLVLERRAARMHVRFVDMSAVSAEDLADGLHPNDAGYRKMAAAFREAIDAAILERLIASPADMDEGWCASSGIDDSDVDMNGDRKADYLAVADDGSVRAWINRGGDLGGGWEGLGQVAAGMGVSSRQVMFADVDGDRRADYLAVADNGSVRAWINRGVDSGGGWEGWGQIAAGVGAPGSQVRFADIDGDGKADYLVVADSGSVDAWISRGGDGHGGWAAWGRMAAGVGAPGSQIRFADIDGDGKADYLVVAENGSVQAWINRGGDGHGGWERWGQIATGVGVPSRQVRFADVDGDGKSDYLTVADDSSVQAWINRGGDGHGGWEGVGRIASGVGVPGNQIRL